MGRHSELMIEMQQEEAMKRWIHIHGGPDIEEGTEEWESLESAYELARENGELESEDDWMDEYYIDLNIEEEIAWAKKNGHIEAYKNFENELNDMALLIGQLPSQAGRMVLKMRLSYAVTLMESCLKEMLVSVAFSNSHFTQNAANIEKVSEIKIPVNKVLNDDAKKIVENRIYQVLNDLLYHNFKEVFNYYKTTLNTNNFDIESDVKRKVAAAISLRHDIVHRNGKTKDGDLVDISKHLVDDYISNIEAFVGAMREFITGSMDALEVAEINKELVKQGMAPIFK